MSTEREIVPLFGNVGQDPRLLQFPGKEGTGKFYDPIIDEVVERTVLSESRELTTFSIAINYVKEGEKKVRWVNCDDWKGLCSLNLVRKGDRVALSGYFVERAFLNKKGERIVARNYVVENLRVERRKRVPREE
jgi:single-stranded DNA-binding protein